MDAFNDKQRLADRDVSSARIAANPNPHKDAGEMMTRIRQLQTNGLDVEAIRLEIGTVSFNGALPDYLAIGGIMHICRTGPSIVEKLVLK